MKDLVGKEASKTTAREDMTKEKTGIETQDVRSKGLSFGMASFFMVAQMAGAGFLTLPRAMANAGWSGLALVIIFCISVCFSGTRLGRCWVILEERWPSEYSQPVRQPYMEIAYRSFGIHGRRGALFCVLFSLIGSTIVYAILIAELMSDVVPVLSQCQWLCIVGAILIPLSWLGSPKDFWQASVLAVVATILAVVVIIVRIIIDYGAEESLYPDPTYPNPSITTFSLGFGAILFAYSGASVFPTIQNDMKDRSHFSKAAILAFTVIVMMYIPVAAIGYYYIGSAVKNNILLSVNSNIFVTIAIALQIINLVGTLMISLSPVVQSLEDLLGVPLHFGWKRVLLRSSLVTLEILVGVAMPDFGLILNLIGGSTVTCLSFLFPPLCYMKLVGNKSKEWPERTIPVWQKVYLWIIAAVGVIGGVSATVSALMAILNPDSFGRSCFAHFGIKNATEDL